MEGCVRIEPSRLAKLHTRRIRRLTSEMYRPCGLQSRRFSFSLRRMRHNPPTADPTTDKEDHEREKVSRQAANSSTKYEAETNSETTTSRYSLQFTH
ncbi:hypothetical protein V9T40_004648 [Parthenolecanium corni]|uniref:Uncharacterized protein n=1 Tax=Parthenolecanium corni TaxID=536013 RepID=A0AAN9TCP3_9HEMI